MCVCVCVCVCVYIYMKTFYKSNTPLLFLLKSIYIFIFRKSIQESLSYTVIGLFIWFNDPRKMLRKLYLLLCMRSQLAVFKSSL